MFRKCVVGSSQMKMWSGIWILATTGDPNDNYVRFDAERKEWKTAFMNGLSMLRIHVHKDKSDKWGWPVWFSAQREQQQRIVRSRWRSQMMKITKTYILFLAIAARLCVRESTASPAAGHKIDVTFVRPFVCWLNGWLLSIQQHTAYINKYTFEFFV